MCVLVVLLTPAVAAQDVRALKSVRAVLVDGVPRVGFDARSFADASVREKLKSGLPQTIMMRVFVHLPGGGKQPLALSAQSCRVIYDLWSGSYHVQLDRPGRSSELSVATAKQVIEQCLVVNALPLSGFDVPRYRGKQLNISVGVELNPLSQATVQRIRRWLSRPAGGQLGGNAFIGSFVSIFVGRDIGSAEKSITYRPRTWMVPR